MNLFGFLFLGLLQLAAAWNTFVVPHTPGQDDTPALVAGLANRTSDVTILFEKGITYNILTPVRFPTFQNVEVRIEGNITLPDNIATVQGTFQRPLAPRSEINALCQLLSALRFDFPGHWCNGIFFKLRIITYIKPLRFSFSGGTNVTLRGSTDCNWGWVDAHGQAWWDAKELNNRPHGWIFGKINGGAIRDMKLWKPIAQSFSMKGSSNIHVFNNRIFALSNSKVTSLSTPSSWGRANEHSVVPALPAVVSTQHVRPPFPPVCFLKRLTLSLSDGFAAGGASNILFEKNHIENGDDCITIGNKAKNITFKDCHCGLGHGASVGSLGRDGEVTDVQDILFDNLTMVNSLYGARFKSWAGGKGLARNITWRNIVIQDVAFPIYVTQNYWDQEKGPKTNAPSGSHTMIQDFLFENFSGDLRDVPYVEGSCISDPCWYNVSGATGKEVAIFDLYRGSAKNIRLEDIKVVTQTGAKLLASHETNTLLPLEVTPLHAIPNWAGLLSLTTLRLGVICPDLEAVQKRIDMTSTQSEPINCANFRKSRFLTMVVAEQGRLKHISSIDVFVPLKWSADSIQLELRVRLMLAVRHSADVSGFLRRTPQWRNREFLQGHVLNSGSGSTRSDCLADVSGVSLADRGTVLDRTTLGMNELHRLLCVRFGFLNCFCIMSSRYDTSNQYNPVVHECPDVRLPGFLSTLEGRVIAAAHKLSEEFPFNRDYNISDQAGVDMTTGYNGLRGDAATFYPAPPVCGKIKFAYASHTFAAKEKGRNICSYQEKRGIHFSSNDFRCSGAVHSLEENHSLFRSCLWTPGPA
uniref:galacturonan 1,4-alpha-galacturonidase n=1 Tax=Moniliophthora roreri TaxID=221103 RepID=A0A0W0FJ62_MONRR